MLYRKSPANADKISQLGFGCMRLPRKGTQIDMEKTTQLIKFAVEHGVNYFDTAYIYPGSEEALGTALQTTGLRDKVKIATKLPLMLVKTTADFDKLFNKQLERLKTDRVDYYLMHMLASMESWEALKSLGIIEWIEKKKKEGKILSIGFSFHGGKLEFKKLVDCYKWDFCMIQYNYLDENKQASKEGLQYANKKGLPVIIMEPLRGGTLVNSLPKHAKEIFAAANKDRSLVDWAFRWLWNQPEVTMVLSGMGNMRQLKENIRLSKTGIAGSFTKEDFAVYEKVLKTINKTIKVPCTGCGYCMPCPCGVDIPSCFSSYNETYSGSFMQGVTHYFMTTGAMSTKQSYASKCVKCKKCEKHCPQQIEISKRLGDVSFRMESFWFRPVFSFVRRFTKIGK